MINSNKEDFLNKKVNTKDHNNTLANAPQSKKIGFFSAMMIAFGSCVGAGIFFKANSVLESSNGSFIFAMFSWVLAGFVVMSMALALIEISSARNDNLSLIGWCKTFNSRIMYKACKNFMFYIYLPLTYFFMPLYVIMSIQDGISSIVGSATIGTSADWSIMMVISIIMSTYFILTCGLSSKIGNIQNLIITSLKFIPLVLAVIFGIWGASLNPEIINNEVNIGFSGGEKVGEGIANGSVSFKNMTPGFGLFVAMGAIFFAYDGFYVTAGLQTEMKEPKKTPIAILAGLGLVTAVYLIVAISMSLGIKFNKFLKDGKLNGTNTDLSILNGVYNILIGIGVIGIINGFALWSPRFTEDLIRENEVPFSYKALKLMNTKYKSRPLVGTVYNIIISIPIIVIFCMIGGLGYIDAAGYGSDYGAKDVAGLYSFADLMGTWTAVFAFFFIILAIMGGLSNRKTKKIETINSKMFKPFGLISVIIGGLVVFITFFGPFVDLFLIFALDSNKVAIEHSSNDYYNQIIISRILIIIVFFLKIAIMIIPTIIEDYFNIKKYGSLEAAEKSWYNKSLQ